mmetsp:Transcript_60082/g.123386  ORF Transcript_60082/g.123386 Transcript_60082/m.123386 type:complete len:226 (-) Transcript_60082:50-727(-)
MPCLTDNGDETVAKSGSKCVRVLVWREDLVFCTDDEHRALALHLRHARKKCVLHHTVNSSPERVLGRFHALCDDGLDELVVSRALKVFVDQRAALKLSHELLRNLQRWVVGYRLDTFNWCKHGICRAEGVGWPDQDQRAHQAGVRDGKRQGNTRSHRVCNHIHGAVLFYQLLQASRNHFGLCLEGVWRRLALLKFRLFGFPEPDKIEGKKARWGGAANRRSYARE